jgi:hypothetical protein
VSLSSGDEVPHIFTRKSRLQPGEFLITSAKRLLQQYLPGPDTAANQDPRSPAEQNGDRDQRQTEAHEPETRDPPASVDVFCPVVAGDEQQADHEQV